MLQTLKQLGSMLLKSLVNNKDPAQSRCWWWTAHSTLQTHSKMEPGSDLETEVKPCHYNVNRISRLVNMYHAFHHYTEAWEGEDERLEVTSSSSSAPARSFLCPHCDKRMWRSIETFRVHKAHCRTRGAALEPGQRHYCADCRAAFKTGQEYRNHIRGLADKKDDGAHQTRVCSLHCGSAFSQTTCLQHHSVECFAKQTMGPFNVIICKDN